MDGTDCLPMGSSVSCAFFHNARLPRDGRCVCRHKQERKFPCPSCGKRFGFKDGLERHLLVHPPYECPTCARVFSTAAELQV